MARPSDFTDELADKICLRMAEGRSLNAICQDPDMPHRVTVLRWLQKHEPFRTKYVQAREDLINFHGDRLLELADGATAENVQVAKLQIDTRKWIMSKV